jgi:hypothetical protein
MYDKLICRTYVLSNILCIEEYELKLKNKIYLIETEYHRQSIHGRLPSQTSNKPGYLYYFLGQKSMTNKYYI